MKAQLDLDKLTKFKTAQAIEAAAKNEGGTAGAGMGMGMGFVLAQQMGGLMNPQMGGQQTPMQQAIVPPPLQDVVTYYYSSNGQQMGPVPYNQLKVLFANRTINRDTLIWKQGMPNWMALKDIEELKVFLGGNTPPPLPQ